MYLKWILILILINNLHACRGDDDGSNGVGGRRHSWISSMRTIRRDVKDCIKATSYSVWNCLKISSLKLLDKLTFAKAIRLWDGIQLVQVAEPEVAVDKNDESKRIDRRDNLVMNSINGFAYVIEVAKRITRLFRTHVLQLSLKDNKVSGGKTDEHGTPRHRRHRNNMIIAMVFGVTALGAVLVPMGFQFLSVVSGKALLLAKMALLLASINGLKKIANSGVHYGLYQVPGEALGYGYYDRGDAHHPRSLTDFTEQPLVVKI